MATGLVHLGMKILGLAQMKIQTPRKLQMRYSDLSFN